MKKRAGGINKQQGGGAHHPQVSPPSSTGDHISRRHFIAAAAGAGALGLLAASPRYVRAQARPKTTLKFGYINPVDSVHHQAAQRIAEDVKSRTNGDLQIDLFPGGQLGSEKDMIDGNIVGSIQLTMGSGLYLAYAPKMGIVDAPYVFRDVGHLVRACRGVIGQEINEQLVAKGMRSVGVFLLGARKITTGKKPIAKLEDLKGLKLRVPNVATYIAFFKAVGTNPVAIPIQEAYLALQTGMADGQENPWAQIWSFKFYEVQKYLAKTDHVINVNFVTVSEKWWATAPAEFRQALGEAIEKGAEWQVQTILENEGKLEQEWRTRGNEITTPDPAPFRKVADDVLAQFEEKWGKGLLERARAVS
jgi:TRAP-type transport system periplasmic protein